MISFTPQIKVAMYTDGEEKAQLIFDSRGSTMTNFFSRNRYLGGGYEDIKTAPIKFVG